jgi:Ca-activated chloride channel homolog
MSLLELHFLRPAWLLALIPLAVLLWLLARRRLGDGPWARVCDAGLLPHLLQGTERQLQLRSLLLVGVTGLIAILALAGPSWDRLQQPLYHDTRALVIALDLSRAMDAVDVQPSRLVRARYKIADILAERREGVTGLVVYSGEAFTVTPLSTDTATIKAQLNVLSTDLMPVPGNRTERALARSRDLFRQAGYNRGDILLVTAGAGGTDRLYSEVASLHEEGFRISILGVGTEAGAPIPAEPDGYLRDRHGAIVIPRLDPETLSRLAATGGGVFQIMQPDDRDIERLAAHFADMAGADVVETGLDSELWLDRGPWLVLLLLPLALLAFRRGLIMALAVTVCLPFSHQVEAVDWDRLWLNDNQRGNQALTADQPERAAELFRDPEWRAIASYRAGDYMAAIESLEAVDTPRSWYNRGNALARLGMYQQAISAYTEALQREPGLEDARYNRDLLQELLQDMQPDEGGDEEQRREQGPAQRDGDDGELADSGHDEGPHTGGDTEAGQLSKEHGDYAAADDPGPPAGEHGERPDHVDHEGEDMTAAARERDLDADAVRPQQRRVEHERDEPGRPEDAGDELATMPGGTTRAPERTEGQERADDARQEADEQWLRRVEDDPGGLLRRKFLQQYRRQHALQPYQLE